MRLRELEQQIRDEFPEFKVVAKSNSKLMKAIDIFLKVITFGQMTGFMTRFITTVGYTVYVTDTWSTHDQASRAIILRHERVHMRQRKKYGSFLFSFLYLFFPFPVGLAYYRMKFEKEGYEESMKALVEQHGMAILKIPSNKQRFVDHFTTSQYFWMWPFKGAISRWYDEVVERLEP